MPLRVPCHETHVGRMDAVKVLGWGGNGSHIDSETGGSCGRAEEKDRGGGGRNILLGPKQDGGPEELSSGTSAGRTGGWINRAVADTESAAWLSIGLVAGPDASSNPAAARLLSSLRALYRQCLRIYGQLPATAATCTAPCPPQSLGPSMLTLSWVPIATTLPVAASTTSQCSAADRLPRATTLHLNSSVESITAGRRYVTLRVLDTPGTVQKSSTRN